MGKNKKPQGHNNNDSSHHKNTYTLPLLIISSAFMFIWTVAGVYQLITTGQSSILLAVVSVSTQISHLIGKF